MPQDGPTTQDCEQAAGTRWIMHHAQPLVPHHVTLWGDDLYSKAPFCALALHPGFHFLLVCQPDAHPKLYERLAFGQPQGVMGQCAQRRRPGPVTEVALYRFIHEVLLQAGKHTLSVPWLELTVLNAKTGAQLSDNTFIPTHRRSAQNVAQVAQAGRGRWQIANENPNGLKTKGYHLEHNCGHGKP